MLETATLSPVSSADKASARADWLALAAAGSGYVSPPNPDAMTFCQCCGSQYLNREGKMKNVYHTNHLGFLKPREMKDATEKHYRVQYGKDAHLRFGTAEWNRMLLTGDRVNKVGVTLALIPMKEAIPSLYDPDEAQYVDGYEINDADQGHPVCVIWTNK